MNNKDILEFNTELSKLGEIKTKKFAYAVLKNKILVEKEIEIFEQIKMEAHPQLEEYEIARTTACEKMCKRDEEGTPIIEDGTYVIEDLDAFSVYFNEVVTSKFSGVIEHLTLEEQKYNEFLNAETEIELTKVSFDDLPDEINANTLYSIRFMLTDI